MRLVIDTNKLFTFFWKGSLIKKLSLAGHSLFSPELALEELDRNKEEIITKANISEKEFQFLKNILKNNVAFIPFEKYHEHIPRALELLKDNAKDIDFLALAMYLRSPIISDDRELKNQSEIRVFNNEELGELI